MHKVTLRLEMRKNTYNPDTGVVTVSSERAHAIKSVAEHYVGLFTAKDKDFLELRKNYTFPLTSVLDNQNAQNLTAFFFWSAWSAVLTDRINISHTLAIGHTTLL